MDRYQNCKFCIFLKYTNLCLTLLLAQVALEFLIISTIFLTFELTELRKASDMLSAITP